MIVQSLHAQVFSFFARFDTEYFVLLVDSLKQLFNKLAGLTISKLIPAADTQMQGLARFKLIGSFLIARALPPQPQLNGVRLCFGVGPYFSQARIYDFFHVKSLRANYFPGDLKLAIILNLYLIAAGKFGVRAIGTGEFRRSAATFKIEALANVHVLRRLAPGD